MKEIYLAGFEIDHHKTDDDANYIAVEDAGEQSFLIHVLSDLVNHIGLQKTIDIVHLLGDETSLEHEQEPLTAEDIEKAIRFMRGRKSSLNRGIKSFGRDNQRKSAIDWLESLKEKGVSDRGLAREIEKLREKYSRTWFWQLRKDWKERHGEDLKDYLNG